MRISVTTLDCFRLWKDPNQEWMSEDELQTTIRGEFVPTHNVELGQAFGQVLEDPDRYRVPGGFRSGHFDFGADVVEPCLAVIDRRGVFEAKAQKRYGDCDVVAKADHLLGLHLSEFKTTLNTFDVQNYLDAYQWRFMVDIFEPLTVTYHVFCLAEGVTGVVSLRGIETFNVFPYAGLHEDCCALLDEFTWYVRARGLAPVLQQRQRDAA